jgi:putative spermidine/putrescine transport system substrate-binding protein
MCYNTQKVQELGITAPDSWEDLFDPVWKGKIVVQTPENPEAHTQLIKFQEIGGGDVTDASMTQGLKLWKENFMPNEPTFVPGATAQVNAFTNGTAWIGIVPSGRIFRMKQSGLPVEFVLPKENSLALFDDLQVAFGTSAKKLAEKWINFLIGPEMQKAFANSVHYGMVNKKVTLTDEEKKYTLTPDQLQKIPAFPDTFVSTNREAWTTALEKIIAGG